MRKSIGIALALCAMLGFSFISTVQAQSVADECLTQPVALQSQCTSLVDLYTSTDGDNWNTNTNWLTRNSVCTWHGVTCNRNRNRILAVSLQSNTLQGVLPDTLDGLTYLRGFNVAGNSLCGIVPDSLFSIDTLAVVNVQKNNLLETNSTALDEYLANGGIFMDAYQTPEACSQYISTVEATSINLIDVDVVQGTENVDLIKFILKNDDISPVFIHGFTITGIQNFDAEHVTTIRLRKRTSLGYTLVSEKGAFEIQNNQLQFDAFSDFDEILIPESSFQEFLVTADLNDGDTILGDQLSVEITQITGESNYGVIEVSQLPVNSSRTVTIIPFGLMNVRVDYAGPLADSSTYVLAGENANAVPYVASFELIIENEPIEINDLTIVLDGDINGFGNASNEVILYDEDGNVLGSEIIVTNGSLRFEDIGIFDEGATNLYVKVVAEPIGDNENGSATDDLTMSLTIGETEGVDSEQEGEIIYDGIGQTAPSYPFTIVPVTFFGHEFILSALGNSVNTVTTNGTDETIALFSFVASDWQNYDLYDGSNLEAIIESIRFESNNTTDVTNYRLKRLGTTSPYVPGTINGNQVDFTLGDQVGVNVKEIDGGEEVVFAIVADIDAGTDNTTVQLTFEIEGSMLYHTSDNTFSSNEFRTGIYDVTSPYVTIQNN